MEGHGISLIKLRNDGKIWKLVSPAPATMRQAGESTKEAKTRGVFHKLNKLRRMKRLKMIENEMRRLQRQMDKVREDAIRDRRLYHKLKKQRLQASQKSAQVPEKPSSSRPESQKNELMQGRKMSTELIVKLNKMLCEEMHHDDYVDIMEKMIYFNFDPDVEEEEDDFLNLRNLSGVDQWRIWAMAEKKLENGKKRSLEVVEEKETEEVPALPVDALTLGAVPEGQPDPAPGCSVWNEADVPTTDKLDNKEICEEDDDDDDDDTLLDIY